MSQMPPYLRAYRKALRDAQLALLAYGRTFSGPASTKFAISATADLISILLRQLREQGSKSLNEAEREQMSASLAEHVAVAQGYRAGYTKAVHMVGHRAQQMRDPAAREAIGEWAKYYPLLDRMLRASRG